jgi:predicted flavoprotein YhiN
MTQVRNRSLSSHDVIILGAGAAGLMCALSPVSADARCCCLSRRSTPARRYGFPVAKSQPNVSEPCAMAFDWIKKTRPERGAE